MDKSFKLKIVTPNEVAYEGSAVSIIAPGELGYLGILKDHAPMVTTLGKGKLTSTAQDGKILEFQIEGGFLEVMKNRVLVLTDKV